MSRDRLPPPAPAICLVCPCPSSQKGGTLIVEGVLDREAHEWNVRHPDSYRPEYCARCGHDVLHIHDYRERKLRAESADPVATVVRFICTACLATWQVLPLFIARHLWRSWWVVEAFTAGKRDKDQPEVPQRTQRRWRARLCSCARSVVQTLASSGRATLEALAERLGLGATRAELVAEYAAVMSTPARRLLSDLAALVHRLVPGIRLM